LRGKSDREVIANMLSVTDSRFQGELLALAKRAGKIERSFELPLAWRDNTPDRIARVLAPLHDAKLLPRFPFGSDFTSTEQRLLSALILLRASSRLQLARLAIRGAASTPLASERDCITRMGLDQRSHPADVLYAWLMRGALAATRHPETGAPLSA
jgi:hypothetical protein